MNRARFLRIKEVFLAARNLASAERDVFLTSRCRDPILRTEVLRLLHASELAGDALRMPVLGTTFSVPDPEQLVAVDVPSPMARLQRVGRYTIAHVIKEGALAIVYLAMQHRPRRQVALKVVRPGVVTRATLARFRREAELLGRLEHPAIARIYEAGTAPSSCGRVAYIAMEYVPGADLLAHAMQHCRSARERIAMLIEVCDAVQFAHERGVIHRDLKPANILVARSGQVKVIDFGIGTVVGSARAVAHGERFGTPPYVSPEQLAGGAIDARTDVHALGVIARELLAPIERRAALDLEAIGAKATARHPDRRYQSAAELAADLGRHLRCEPVRARNATPWYLLSTLVRRRRVPLVAGALLALFVAAVWIGGQTWIERRLAPAVLRAQGRAEALTDYFLDVLKTIHHLPDGPRQDVLVVLERISVDAERLADQPETAAMVRLNLAATYRCLGVLAPAVAQAHAAADLGERALGASAPLTLRARLMHAQLLLATGDLDAAGAALSDLEPILRARRPVDPGLSTEGALVLGDLLRQRGALGDAEALLRDALLSPPPCDDELGDAGEPRIELSLANVLCDQGEFVRAAQLYARALESSRSLLGPGHPETLAAQGYLGRARCELGDVAAGIAMMRDSAERCAHYLGEVHPLTLAQRHNLASALAQHGDRDEGEALLVKVHEARARVLGPHHLATLATINNLAVLYRERGSPQRAVELLAPFVPSADSAGDRTYLLGILRGNLGASLIALGRYAEAEASLEAARAMLEASLGDRHAHTLRVACDLGLALLEQDKLAQAELVLTTTLASCTELFGEEGPETLRCCHNLAEVLARAGRTQDAESVGRATLARREEQLGKSDPRTLVTRHNLAGVLATDGRFAEALALYQQNLELAREQLAPGHWYVMLFESQLGLQLERLDRRKQALIACRHACELGRASLPTSDVRLATLVGNLGLVLLEGRAASDAEPLLEECLTIRQALLAEDHPDCLRAMNNLAVAWTEQHKLEQAEALLRRTLAMRERVLGAAHPDTVVTRNNLAELLTAVGKLDEAEQAFTEILTVANPQRWQAAVYRGNLGACLLKQEQLPRARAELEHSLADLTRFFGASHPRTVHVRRQLDHALARINGVQPASSEER